MNTPSAWLLYVTSVKNDVRRHRFPCLTALTLRQTHPNARRAPFNEDDDDDQGEQIGADLRPAHRADGDDQGRADTARADQA